MNLAHLVNLEVQIVNYDKRCKYDAFRKNLIYFPVRVHSIDFRHLFEIVMIDQQNYNSHDSRVVIVQCVWIAAVCTSNSMWCTQPHS